MNPTLPKGMTLVNPPAQNSGVKLPSGMTLMQPSANQVKQPTPPIGGLSSTGKFTPTSVDLGNKLKGDASGMMDNIMSDISSNNKMAGDVATNGGTTAPTLSTSVGPALLGAAKSVVDIGGDVAKAGFKGVGDIVSSFIPQKVKDAYGDATNEVLPQIKSAFNDTMNDPKAKPVADFINHILNAAKDNPEVAKTIGNAASMVMAPSALEGGMGVMKKGADLVSSGVETAASVSNKITTGTMNTVSDIVSSAKNKVFTPPVSDVQTIADTISPKLNVAEKRLAMSQGRIVEGKEPTLFRSGTPDQVLSSDKVTESAFTIDKEILGAAKMSDTELHTALEARTTDMARQLQPEMQKVPLNQNTTAKMNKDWETLKKRQIEGSDATEEPNIVKQQKQFESRIKGLTTKNGLVSTQKNFNDLWQERISYDNSIPPAVKKANSLSDSRLLAKKETWLQNRAILNDAINDTQNGIGGKSRQAFKDMSNMYNAKANLLSKANVELGVTPSKVSQWMKAHPYIVKTAKTAGLLVGGGEVIRHLPL